MAVPFAGPVIRPGRQLPVWRSVLAVVAHPDDESFGLGALLSRFSSAGAVTRVLTFTHGEASTLHGAPGDLREIRAAELQVAARILGVSRTTLLAYPDGALAAVAPAVLAQDVAAAAHSPNVDGLLVFDTTGVTGHGDHIAATRAALAFAEIADLPVLGWTIPTAVADAVNRELGNSLVGRPAGQIDICARADRAVQRRAVLAHASQATSQVLWRRLQLLGDCEHLVWLRRAGLEGGT